MQGGKTHREIAVEQVLGGQANHLQHPIQPPALSNNNVGVIRNELVIYIQINLSSAQRKRALTACTPTQYTIYDDDDD